MEPEQLKTSVLLSYTELMQMITALDYTMEQVQNMVWSVPPRLEMMYLFQARETLEIALAGIQDREVQKEEFITGHCCDYGPCALHIQLAQVHENGGHTERAHKDCKLCAL
jgi:hypothetical protein